MFTITEINEISNQASGLPFAISGTIALYPTLNYSDDGSHFSQFQAPTPYGVSTWSILHPAMGLTDSATVTIQEGTTLGIAVSNSFAVKQLSISPHSPSGAVEDVAFTFTGDLVNFPSTPNLDYVLDGGSPTSLTGVTASGWSTQFTISTSGTHTIEVSGAGVSGSVAFAVAASGAVSGSHVLTLTPNTPSGVVAGLPFEFTGGVSGVIVAPSLVYELDSGLPIPLTGVGVSGWAASLTVAASGSHTLLVSGGGASGEVTFTASGATVSGTASGEIWATTTFTSVSGSTVVLNQATVANQYANPLPAYGAQEIMANAYWEVVVTSPTSNNGSSIGLGPVNGAADSGDALLLWGEDGFLASDGGYQNAGQWGTWTNAALLCFALDRVNNKIYGRVGVSGLWNASGTADPATNTGGLPIPASILAAPGMVVAGQLYEFNSSLQANVTADTIQGVAPTGFPVLGGGVSQPRIVPNTPVGTVSGVPFNFTGELLSFPAEPTPFYSLDGAPAEPLTGVTFTGWSESFTMTTVGDHTIVVSAGGVSGSVSFTTAAVPVKQITPNAPLGAVAGQAVSFTGSLVNFPNTPALDYILDGGSPTTLTGVTQTGWVSSITVSTSGTHTIEVSGAGVSGSVSFHVAPFGVVGVPAQASAVGFNQLTYGPNLVLSTETDPDTGYPAASGGNIYPFTFFGTGWTAIRDSTTVNSDGSITINGEGSTFGNSLSTALTGPPFGLPEQIYGGIAFGGGGYFEVVAAFEGPTSWWANNLSTMNGAGEGWGDMLWAGQSQIMTVGGSATSGDVLRFLAFAPWMNSGEIVTLPYTVPGGASLSTVAAGMAAVINSTLGGYGVSATSSGADITIETPTGQTPGVRFNTSVQTGAFTETFSVNGYGQGFEVDAMEFDQTNLFGWAFHNWHGSTTAEFPTDVSPNWGGGIGSFDSDTSSWVPPAGIDYTQPNKYGFLWVTATDSTPGYAKFFFNDVQIGNTCQWNKFDPTVAPPPVAGAVTTTGSSFGTSTGFTAPDTAWAGVDDQHLAFIFGSDGSDGGALTSTFYSMSVWQANGDNNIVSGSTTVVSGSSGVGGGAGVSGSPAILTTSSGGQIVESNGTILTINSAGVIEQNGTAIPGGSGSSAVTYIDGVVYGQDSTTSNWYTWNGTQWTLFGHTLPSTTPTMVVNAPVGAVQSTAFAFTGSLFEFSSAPTLDYKLDGGTSTALTGVTASGWSENLTITTAGSHTLAVSGGGVSGSVTFTVSASGAPSGGRQFYEIIGGDRSLLTTPQQTTASWIMSGPQIDLLHSMTFANVRSFETTGFVSPFWVSESTGDVLCTFHDSTGTIPDFHMHVPAGAYSENGSTGPGDNAAGFVDKNSPYKYVTINDCRIGSNASNATAAGVVSATNNFIMCGPGNGSPGGMVVQDATGPTLMDAVNGTLANGKWENGDNVTGCITYYDLLQCIADPSYVIQHTVAVNLGENAFSNTGQLLWPFVIGDVPGTGSIPEGAMIGIPASTTRPTGMTRGAAVLFDVFQHFCGIFNNATTNGQIAVKTMPRDAATAALVADMLNQFGSIVPYLRIMNYTPGVAGAQYSADTLKGKLPGAVWSDAFPAPATLDYSPTGGARVLPSTFGAWDASNGLGEVYNTIWENN